MQKYISNLIKLNGFIPLDEFILTALCHPINGYYSKQNPITKDFITSPEITNAFGIILGNFIFNKILNHPEIEKAKEIHFVELGGGSGKLAFDVLNFLLNLKKLNNEKINSIIKKINFHSIEFSGKLKLIQKNALENILIKKYFWNNISEFLEFINNCEKNKNNFFVFFSNEFFDALPIKQFSFDGTDFSEIVVTEQNNNFIYERIKINSEKFKLIPQEIKINENDILEIQLMGIKILKDIATIMKNNKSIFIAFDYGFFQSENTSTLQGIFNGQKTLNILENIGETDITHLVNFHMLAEVFRKEKISTHLQTQKEFLIENGIEALIHETNKDGIKRIVETMNSLFKVLIAENL